MLDRLCKKYVTPSVIISLSLLFISITVQVIANSNLAFAEWVSSGIGYFFRRVLAEITDIFPFSIGEVLLLLVPLFITLIIVAVSRKTFCREYFVKLLSGILLVLCVIYFLYVFTLGVEYKRVSVSDKLSLTDVDITKENLYVTLITLKEKAEEELEYIEFSESGASVNAKSMEELSAIICDSYALLNEKYPSLNIGNFRSDAKPVLLSEGMTALDITGIYSFFTGEANVNVHFPDYCIPYTLAHELAHQRGIARENEANFIAFLACIESSDAYVRYSGYVNMYEYLASALYKTDKQALSSVYSITDSRIIGEMNAYSEFYRENSNDILGSISDFINDKYLKAQGTEGIISYGLVVRLCVSYYGNG